MEGIGFKARIWTVVGLASVCFALAVASLGQCGPTQPATHEMKRSPQNTLFVECHENDKPQVVRSPVSLSEDAHWRAYVEVDVRGCLHTTRLWVARANGLYRLIYLIPPNREAAANGMEIIGWARHSRMLLVKTEQWQYGSDAADRQQVLAIDAGTGMVYEPQLEAMLQGREDKQCTFRVNDASFGPGTNVNIDVCARFFTDVEADETEADVPLAKRCSNTEEVWNFDYATGEIKQVGTIDPHRVFRKFVPNRRSEWTAQPRSSSGNKIVNK